MRFLIQDASPGPLLIPPPTYCGDSAYISNASGLMLLDCGSTEHSTSIPDSILFAASRNAIASLVSEQQDSLYARSGTSGVTRFEDPHRFLLLSGSFRSDAWRHAMRTLERSGSPGLFLASLVPDYPFAGDSCAYVTNLHGTIFLDAGPLDDRTSVLDAIIFAAARNAIAQLINEPAEN